MRKLVMLIAGMSMFLCNLYAQKGNTLTGTVTGENNQPLSGAVVLLSPVYATTITDTDGVFTIEGLDEGKYQVSISYMGYKSLADSVTVSGNVSEVFMMDVAAVSLQEVVVTDNYYEVRKREESLNIEIVNDDFLRQNLGGSLMNTLERLPGVTALTIGSGQSKPVIRGLGFNRVVVVENNIKHEAQQWGADHGLEIDQYAIERIEVVKGPSSLMYGSDAIGGVIDLKDRDIPAQNSFGGAVDLSGKTNNDFGGASVALFARKKHLYAKMRVSVIDYGDYKVPVDSVDIYSYRAALYRNHLRNTAGSEANMHFTFGIIKNRFQSKITGSSINSKSGFFANAHGLEPRNVDTALHDHSSRDIQMPYQSVSHFKITSNSIVQWKKSGLEMDLGFQRNFREELSPYVQHGYMPPLFPDTLSFDSGLERQFEKYVFSGNWKFRYQWSEKTMINVGVNSEYQDNSISGRGFIIPEFNSLSLGSYLLAKHKLNELNYLQAGLRYDFGHVETTEYYDWFPSPVVIDGDTSMENLMRAPHLNRKFSSFSWSAGYNYNPDNWAIKVNIGKSFRMPTAKELAANGVDFHMYRYVVGRDDLSPEISYQLDAGIEYSSKQFAVGTTPFVNYFSNYIYLNPSPDHDRTYGAGHQKFYHTESKVFRYGGEVHAHYKPLESLQLGIIGEYVYSIQLSGEKRGYTLPFSPPPSAIFNIKYQRQNLKFLSGAYLTVDYKVAAAQKNIVPPEEVTDGYQVINLGIGGDVKIRNQKISFSMQVQNLLNNTYYNHTSYYRLINIPEPGRNFIINLSLPFTGKVQSKK